MAVSCNEQYHKITGLVAGSDLSAKQYYAVAISSGTVAVCNAGAGFIGILLNKPTSGQACDIAGPGSIVQASSDGTMTRGYPQKVSSDGQLLDATDDSVTVGMALEGTTTAGVTCQIMVWRPETSADVSDLQGS
jgi:hypothetical protein